jgi:hypothetical protein
MQEGQFTGWRHRAMRSPAMTERDLEAPEADLAEQLTGALHHDGIDASDAPVEVDPADRVEQQRTVTSDDDGAFGDPDGSVEVDPADRAEQQRSVMLDDDEYR